MEDQAGIDEKIVAVPVGDLQGYYREINTCSDLPAIVRDQIVHFFRHYKDLEEGKWTRVDKWVDAEHAGKLIMEAIARANSPAHK